MGIIEHYHGLEDQWYGLLDRIDPKISVYKIIDPVDKVVPSFALVTGILLLVGFGIILSLLGSGSSHTYSLHFSDEQGTPIPNALFSITIGETTLEKTTNGNGIILLENITGGSTISVTGEITGYASFQKTIAVPFNENTLSFTLQRKVAPSSPLTFQLVDKTGLSLSGKTIQISLHCSTGKSLPQTDYTILQGVFTLTPPEGCEKLIGNVYADGYVSREGVLFSGQNPLVELEPIPVEKGSVKVVAQNAIGTGLANLSVEIIHVNGVSAGQTTTNGLGIALLEKIPVGNYYASITDPSGVIGNSSSDTFEVTPNQVTTLPLTLDKNPVGTIHVTVEDGLTQEKIGNALVKLVKKSTNELISTRVTDGENPVLFSVTENTVYEISVEGTGYLSETIEVPSVVGDVTLTLSLERLTESNAGTIEITVQDEDHLPVDGAQVTLYDGATGFVVHGISPQPTNTSGLAVFTGTKSGTYFARAIKYPAGPSDSLPFTTNRLVPSKNMVTLVIGQAVVKTIVKDEEGNPIPFVGVEYRSPNQAVCAGISCIVETDSFGTATKSFKADKTIFVTVRGDDTYDSFTSRGYTLFPQKETVILVTLPKKTTSTQPEMTLVTLLDTSAGLPAVELKNGKTYTGLFHVRVPSLFAADEIGVHVRTGSETSAENSDFTITQINAPLALITKGSEYHPPAGEEADFESITDGPAKWANVVWSNSGTGEPVSGVIEIGATFKVTNQAGLYAELPLFYRGWVVHDNEWARTPTDSVLGVNQSVGQKQELYADTLKQTYFVGKPLSCGEQFCYAGETLYDEGISLYVNGPPFPVSVNRPYAYTFSLTTNTTGNTNSFALEQAALRVIVTSNGNTPTDEVTLKEYSITVPQGETIDGTFPPFGDGGGINGNTIEIGSFSSGQSVGGSFNVMPTKTGNVHISIQLLSEGAILYEHAIPFEVTAGKNFSLLSAPPQGTAFLYENAIISAVEENGSPLKGVQLTLEKEDAGGNRFILGHSFTDGSGKATMGLPPSLPGTTFFVRGQKGDYYPVELSIPVSLDVVAVSPTNQLSFALGNIPNDEETHLLDVVNKAGVPLTLKEATLSGDFQGLLNLPKMSAHLQKYVGMVWSPSVSDNSPVTPSPGSGPTKTIEILASTTNTLNVLESKNLSGNLALGFQKEGNPLAWWKSIPLSVGIDSIAGCDEGGLVVSGLSSNNLSLSSVAGSTVSTPFELVNTCIVNGKPLPLKNVRAILTWNSIPAGNVEIGLNDTSGSGTGNGSVENVLPNGKTIPLLETINVAEQSSYTGVFRFTPFSYAGEMVGNYEIVLSADVGGGADAGIITQKINTEMTITSLETCIVTTPSLAEGITIPADDDSVEFDIDTSACGVPIDIFLCRGLNNEHCQGGAEEGYLFPSVGEKKQLAGNQTVHVERKSSTLAGTYDITIDARTKETSYRPIARLPVIVEAKNNAILVPDRTSFTLFGKNSADGTGVVNNWFREDVKVTANACDWSKVAQKEKSRLANSAVASSSIQSSSTGDLVTYLVSPFEFVSDLFGDDPCSSNDTHKLPDYVINLAGDAGLNIAPDALTIELSPALQSFTGKWSLGNRTITSADDAENAPLVETVGMEIQNPLGITSPIPSFGVATLRTIIHHHGDTFHEGNAKVTCHNAQFGSYKIGGSPSRGDCSPATDGTFEEKYHIKIQTAEEETIPPISFDGLSCVGNGMSGITGEGALPRISLTWNWNNSSGISINSCDASNPDAIYCDATQFNIMAMKRIHALEEFLSINGNTFACPDNPNQQSLNVTIPAEQAIGPNTIGFASAGYDFVSGSPSTIHFWASVKNNSAESQTIQWRVTPHSNNDFDIVPIFCAKPLSIGAGQTQNVECTISGFGVSEEYYAEYELAGIPPGVEGDYALFTFNTKSVSDQLQDVCTLPRSTAISGDVSIINRWLDKTNPTYGKYVNQENITYTKDVPDLETLDHLLHFDALLIRDGYTSDFQNDFKKYYTQNAFADAPPWFKGLSSGGNALASYYGTSNLYFSQKYVDSQTLPTGGKYRVELNGFFGDDWSFFNSGGIPTAKIGVVFQHIEDATPNSPFYRIPFDGLVGIEGTAFQRVGYGSGYVNLSNNTIPLNNGLVQTYSGGNAAALVSVDTDIKQDIRSLNALPSSRGVLLSLAVNSQEGTGSMVFSPSMATPVMGRITKQKTPNPFSVLYGLNTSSHPIDTGNTLTFWEGAGSCYDFSGVPIQEAFSNTPDRAGLPEDKLPNWTSLYALDWENAQLGGKEYVRTIFYTPGSEIYSLQSASESLVFRSGNNPVYGGTQLLDGAKGQPYNNQGQSIHAVEELFQLVKTNQVCVSDTGIQAKFFWNPSHVYQGGVEYSVSAETNELQAGVTCLGP